MSALSSIKGREVLDSRGNPTIEVEVSTREGVFRAIAPSGASTGKYESVELRDHRSARYCGKGVLLAVEQINSRIAPQLKGKNPLLQKDIDEQMIQLDGTFNKKKLGAN